MDRLDHLTETVTDMRVTLATMSATLTQQTTAIEMLGRAQNETAKSTHELSRFVAAQKAVGLWALKWASPPTLLGAIWYVVEKTIVNNGAIK